MSMDLDKMCSAACEVAKIAGAFIAGERKGFSREAVEVKSFNQLVSYVDRNAEEKLTEGLRKVFPEAGFITEEKTIATDEREYMWVIDPLDGTTNFVHGIPVFSVSIGLMQRINDKLVPVIGVVHEINRNETFYAHKNCPARMNGTEIRVKKNPDLGKALLATGFPYYDFDIMQKYLETLHVLMKESEGMRRMGSAAVDLAYVACGRFDGFFEYGLNPWDVAGGALIVQQAGGIVTDFKGGGDHFFGREIVAASTALHPVLLDIVHSKFHGS